MMPPPTTSSLRSARPLRRSVSYRDLDVIDSFVKVLVVSLLL
jgi:hypothetical protein